MVLDAGLEHSDHAKLAQPGFGQVAVDDRGNQQGHDIAGGDTQLVGDQATQDQRVVANQLRGITVDHQFLQLLRTHRFDGAQRHGQHFRLAHGQHLQLCLAGCGLDACYGPRLRGDLFPIGGGTR
jgi:hypothetical protein